MSAFMVSETPNRAQVPPRDPVLSDARASARIGLLLSKATQMLDAYHPMSVTAGSQFPLARNVIQDFLEHASQIDPDMTVEELHNLMTTGRR